MRAAPSQHTRAHGSPPVLPAAGRARAVIEDVTPRVDGGRLPVKRIEGDRLVVEADVFGDGHDVLHAVVRWRREGDGSWDESPMVPLVNDRWQGAFPLDHVGRYEFTIEAWVDPYLTWRRDLRKRVDAKQDVRVDLRIGAQLVRATAERAPAADRKRLQGWARTLNQERTRDAAAATDVALGDDLAAVMERHPDRRHAVAPAQTYPVVVDPVRARASAWYEVFPRSLGRGGRHGTLRDLIRHLPYVSQLGFDVVYLPPIHPIGSTHRKGKNNATKAKPDDVGSPWAIGSPEGGHKSVHPDLGTLEDFEALVATARDRHGIDVALDIALQCSPDHPYVREHPQWFRKRPDGTIQYAENPPKKYEDVVPIDFETEDWQALWLELRSVFDFWVHRGVRTFRVDNPHTKPFAFWEWLIRGVKEDHPDVLFLSEAFTRPKIMYRLAKLGFTHSYTYFAWRHQRWDLTEYFTELTQTPVREFFRPHLWPNTPDILTETLQSGERPAFALRFLLAATLGANYGIYGPAFELMEHRPRERGKEEYLDSEKYELREWELERRGGLAPLLTRVNAIRRANPALLRDDGLRFHPTDNGHLMCYSKRTPDRDNVLLVVVNLDPRHAQSGWTDLDLGELGVPDGVPFVVEDLLNDQRFTWSGRRNFVKLDPHTTPAHILRVERPA